MLNLTDFNKTTIMKLRLGLVVLLFLPLMVKGQTQQTPTTPVGVKLFSKGQMYVSSNTKTTMYIKGSAEYANGAAIVQDGRTEITEDFVNSKDPALADAYPQLFEKTSSTGNGVVAFVGTNNKQTIKRADKFTQVGVDAGTSGAVDKPAQKATHYIDFPTISVEKIFEYPYTTNSLDPRKYNYLAVDSSAAIIVDMINIPNEKDRFAIEGGYSKYNPRKMNMGQALIKKYTAVSEASFSQVNLDLYRYDTSTSTDDGTFKPNHEANAINNSLRNSAGENYMTGFTPPFKEMAADYMFYHTLTKPAATSFTSWEGTIVDPYFKMQAGRGYFMSMEVTDYDHVNVINGRWSHDGVLNTNRARGGYVFNRGIMEDYLRQGLADGENQKGYSRFAYKETGGTTPLFDGTSALEFRDKHALLKNEVFVTEAVTVDLTPGFNFLGNPFMAPISLNYLLGLDHTPAETGTLEPAVPGTDFNTGVTREWFKPASATEDIYASSVSYDDTKNMLRSKYWLMNSATVKFDAATTWLTFKATYDFVSRTGGTTSLYMDGNEYDAPPYNNYIAPDKYLIAPMQMFGLQANRAFQIKLDPKLRTFGTTRFLKNAVADNSELLKDYFLVEVVNPTEKTSDRTAVVLREGAKLSSTNDPYDTRKGISKTMETQDKEKDIRTYPAPSTSIVYTRSTNGEDMLGNGVPMNVKELPLYITPPATQQTLSLNFYNLENMESVPNVWLVDKYQNYKTVKLTPGYSYDFTSGPSDLKEVAENRFILRFYGEDETIVKDDESISCYYNTSTLHISGLNEGDINSSVQIYDLQGRLIAKTKVDNAPSMEYLKPLSLGTYILKITGNRNYTAKFVNLQN